MSTLLPNDGASETAKAGESNETSEDKIDPQVGDHNNLDDLEPVGLIGQQRPAQEGTSHDQFRRGWWTDVIYLFVNGCLTKLCLLLIIAA